MITQGSNVNPQAAETQKVDRKALAVQNLTNQIDLLKERITKTIQLKDPQHVEVAEDMVKQLQDEICGTVMTCGLTRQGAELGLIGEYKAELRGRLAVWKSLLKGPAALDEQVKELEQQLEDIEAGAGIPDAIEKQM